MNNKQFALLVVGILCVCSIAFASVFQDKPMRKLSNGTYVVNTTTLAPNVKGFRGATPLEVHIKNNKIMKVVALPNQETPNYFAKVKGLLLPKFAGKSTLKPIQVDGITGATFSSKAVKDNVSAAVRYYKANK